MAHSPKANAEFVAHMEDVLEVYSWPDRDDIRLICMDEISTQLLSDTREALPARCSEPKRQDHEYERNGTANIFIGFEPFAGYGLPSSQSSAHVWIGRIGSRSCSTCAIRRRSSSCW